MQNKQRKRKWYKLDNAAIMIPATTRGSSTRVFRLVCELKENIDPHLLQEALLQTIKEFPHLNVVLRKGMFWYYLDSTDLVPQVSKDDLPACAPLYEAGRRTLLYRVTYLHHRINLEMYHVLADGTGAFVFFRRMLVHYLEAKYGIETEENIEISSLEEKTDDAFRRFYEPKKIKRQIHALKRIQAFKVKGEPDENFEDHLLELHVSAKAFIKLAREHYVTAGVLCASMYIQALLSLMSQQDKNKQIVISVPVNLRQYFPSATTRNFFGTISICYDPQHYDGTLTSIIPDVTASFKENLKEENLKEAMNTLAALEYSPLLRIIPLAVKDPVIGRFAKLADHSVSGTVSNLGRITMPKETVPYIQSFAAYMSKPDSQLCVCSFEDEMIFGYCDGCTDHTVMLEFARILTRNGLQVELASNDMNKEESCNIVKNAA